MRMRTGAPEYPDHSRSTGAASAADALADQVHADRRQEEADDLGESPGAGAPEEALHARDVAEHSPADGEVGEQREHGHERPVEVDQDDRARDDGGAGDERHADRDDTDVGTLRDLTVYRWLRGMRRAPRGIRLHRVIRDTRTRQVYIPKVVVVRLRQALRGARSYARRSKR